MKRKLRNFGARLWPHVTLGDVTATGGIKRISTSATASSTPLPRRWTSRCCSEAMTFRRRMSNRPCNCPSEGASQVSIPSPRFTRGPAPSSVSYPPPDSPYRPSGSPREAGTEIHPTGLLLGHPHVVPTQPRASSICWRCSSRCGARSIAYDLPESCSAVSCSTVSDSTIVSSSWAALTAA